MNPEQPSSTTTNPAPTPAHPLTVDPGKSMAIGGIILGLVLGSPFGLIINAVALQKSRKAGFKNTLALVFTIVFAVLTPFWLIWLVNFTNGLMNL
jgi:predicted outer membrane lipoprotein